MQSRRDGVRVVVCVTRFAERTSTTKIVYFEGGKMEQIPVRDRDLLYLLKGFFCEFFCNFFFLTVVSARESVC